MKTSVLIFQISLDYIVPYKGFENRAEKDRKAFSLDFQIYIPQQQ